MLVLDAGVRTLLGIETVDEVTRQHVDGLNRGLGDGGTTS
jgi:hypothetical protein